MIDDNDLGQIVDLMRGPLNQMIRVAVDEAARKAKIPTLMPGTVTDTDMVNGVAFVLLDTGGDPVACSTLCGMPATSSRVMVQWEPPSVGFVVGYIGGIRNARKVGSKFRRAAAQAVINGSVTNLIFDTADEDADGFIATLPSVNIVVPTGLAGRYMITATVFFASGVGASRTFVQIAGPSQSYRASIAGAAGPPAGDEAFGSVSGWLDLVAGDTFHVQVFQNTAGLVNVTGFVDFWRVAD